MLPTFHLPISIEQLRESDYKTQVSTICDAFEQTWKDGVHPSVAEFANLADPAQRKRVLRELILTERECFEFLPPLASYRDPLCVSQKPSIAMDQTVRNSSDETITLSHGEVENALPSHIDRYAITRLLGEGSYGTVYEAEDVEIRRRVAIKVAKPTNTTEQPFAREAANVGRIDHPAIVPVLDIGQWRGVHYMVSELVEGENLKQWCQSHDVDQERSVAILIELADAIDVAHSCGIIHRDLKPANIIIAEQVDNTGYSPTNGQLRSRVRVIDFGIAKDLDRSTIATMAGDFVGTPHYMSPEQAKGDSAGVGKRSDIFSLGIIFFELLCRKLPFDGPAMVAIAAIRDLDAPSIRSINANIPLGLDAIVSKCLQRDLAYRYNSAKELAEDLRLWRDGQQPIVLKVRYRNRQRQIGKLAALVLIILCGVIVGLKSIPLGKANPLLSSSAASIGSSERKPSIIPSHGLELWIMQGQLPGLNDWLRRYQRGDSDAYDELDAARFGSRGNSDQQKRLQIASACLQTEVVATSDQLAALKYAKSIFPMQLSAFGQFVHLAPVWILDHYLLKHTEMAESVRCEILRELSSRWSRSDRFDKVLALLKEAKTMETSSILEAIEPPPESYPKWQSQVSRELAGIRYESSQIRAEIDSAAGWKAKLALIAYRLGQTDVMDQILEFNPLPQSRSFFIYWLGISNLTLDPLLDRLPNYRDDWRASGVVLCLMNRFDSQQSNEEVLDRAETSDNSSRDLIRRLYAEHPSAVVHRIARTMLTKLNDMEYAKMIDQLPQSHMIHSDRNWYTHPMGMQMNIVRGPITFWYGLPPKNTEPVHPPTDTKLGGYYTIPYSFAYSSELVNEKLYSQFNSAKFVDPQDRAVVDLSWIDATRFLDWMSYEEGLIDTSSLVDNDAGSWTYSLPGIGYRFPSTREWECLARSGTVTDFPYGNYDSDLAKNSNFASEFSEHMEWTATPVDNLRDPIRSQFKVDLFLALAIKGAYNARGPCNLAYFNTSGLMRGQPVGFRVFKQLER